MREKSSKVKVAHRSLILFFTSVCFFGLWLIMPWDEISGSSLFHPVTIGVYKLLNPIIGDIGISICLIALSLYFLVKAIRYPMKNW